MEKQEDVFKKLREINVKPFVKEKGGLSYLSWAVAWRLVIEVFPNATYELKTFDDGMPFKMSPFGAFVSTSVTIEGVTREMTLPVLDGKNKSLKAEGYKYTTKYGDKDVEPINAFDINKAQMRCLVKNLGVFGLGLDLYIGYDLPADLQFDVEFVTEEDIAELKALAKEKEQKLATLLTRFKIKRFGELTKESFNQIKDEWSKL